MLARCRKADLRRLRFEDLEVRLNLSCVTDTIGDQQQEFARASAAVNCFAFDLYQVGRRDPGEKLF